MRILWNGRPYQTEFTELMELAEHMGRTGSDIVIYNGFCRESRQELEEGDSVFLIPRDRIPKEDELEAMLAARHTPGVHEKIKQGRAAVAGLGGLGSHIAEALARTGIGELLLVDFDTVEPSNLNRQNYRICHLGMAKTEAMKRQLEEINPYVKVETRNVQVTGENAAEIFAGYPVAIEAFDRPEAKAELVEALIIGCPETKVVASSGMAGFGSANRIKTMKRMERLYICGDMETEARPGVGLMAPRVQVCAGHQANLALRLLLGEDE